MSKDREEIERWVPSEGMDSIDQWPDLAGPGVATYVLYPDHLRAVKLAQIEALKALPVSFNKGGGGSTYLDRFILLKIAALRKELDGPASAEPETTTNRIANRGWIDE